MTKYSVEQSPQCLVSFVLNTIVGPLWSRAVLDAERPVDVSLDVDCMFINNWAGLVERQGRMLGYLSVIPSTHADLVARTPGMVDRSPAWLEARVCGEPMTWRVFMTGLAQVATVHREAIKRVISEQASDPESIEEALVEAPVPTGSPSEDHSALTRGVIQALFVHTKALAEIAYDLEVTTLQQPRDGEGGLGDL